MPPTWLTVLAWISLASAFVSAALIAADIFVRGYPQHVRIMDVVWPLTALYSGLLGLADQVALADQHLVEDQRRTSPQNRLVFASSDLPALQAALGA